MTSIILRHSAVSAPSTGPSSITPAFIHEDVQAAQLPARRLDERARLPLVGHVAFDREGASAVGLDAVGQGLQALATGARPLAPLERPRAPAKRRPASAPTPTHQGPPSPRRSAMTLRT